MTKTEVRPETIDLKALFSRMNALGFPKDFVSSTLLPSWWCEEFEQTKGAVVEAAAYISRRTSLDFRALLSTDELVTLPETVRHKYKLREGTQKAELKPAQAIADRVAEVVSYACIQPVKNIEGLTAQEIRAEILKNYPCVNLESLLDFCWKNGVPVVHLNHFPKRPRIKKSEEPCEPQPQQKKFDGMVGYFRANLEQTVNRPVIAIGKNEKSHAWLSFILAHEIGHIVCGHVTEESIIDEKITPEPSDDPQEVEADEFAITLLFGRKNASYYSLKNLNAPALTQYAQNYAESDRVDAGAVVLNHSWYKAQIAKDNEEKAIAWKIARASLKSVEKQSNAPAYINSYLVDTLDWENLSDDTQEFLERMTEIEV